MTSDPAASATHASTARLGPLDDILHELRMSGTFYCRARFESPWGVSFEPTPGEARFHLVVEGSATVWTEGLAPIVLGEGDYILLPHGASHAIADAAGSPLKPHSEIFPEYLSERYAQYRQGGDGPGTRVVCVSVRFDDPTARRLLSLLPAAIAMKAGMQGREWLDQTVNFIAAEARQLRAGGETIITRLADVLVVQAIRAWIEHEPDAQRGWLGAVRDEQIGRVIALIHGRPEHPWTLALLAREVGMSRSALAARFRERVGESVMRYLASWRMQLALTSLRRGGTDLGRLAEHVGYQSESAFHRAFKRHVGLPPGAARDALRAAAPPLR